MNILSTVSWSACYCLFYFIVGTGSFYLNIFLNHLFAVHKWAYIPKKGIVSLLPKLKEMTIDLGFTIEARDDNEMPECILASITLDKINPKEVKIIPSELHVDC